MASDKIELVDIANLSSETSAVTALNQNFAKISDELNNTLSLDGSPPNALLAPLDMNGNSIINVGAPTGPNSAARLSDIPTLAVLPSAAGGDVRRINNLSDLTNPAVARANIGAQPYSGQLNAFAAAVFGEGSVPYYSGGGFGLMNTTSFTRSLMTAPDPTGFQIGLGLGNSSIRNVGSGPDNVILGNDARLNQVPVANYTSTGPLYGSDTGKVVRYAGAPAISLDLGSGDFTGFIFTIRVAPGAGSLTISPVPGVALYKAGGTAPGPFTVGAGGLATLLSDAPNVWVISGVGIS